MENIDAVYTIVRELIKEIKAVEDPNQREVSVFCRKELNKSVMETFCYEWLCCEDKISYDETSEHVFFRW